MGFSLRKADRLEKFRGATDGGRKEQKKVKFQAAAEAASKQNHGKEVDVKGRYGNWGEVDEEEVELTTTYEYLCEVR